MRDLSLDYEFTEDIGRDRRPRFRKLPKDWTSANRQSTIYGRILPYKVADLPTYENIPGHISSADIRPMPADYKTKHVGRILPLITGKKDSQKLKNTYIETYASKMREDLQREDTMDFYDHQREEEVGESLRPLPESCMDMIDLLDSVQLFGPIKDEDFEDWY